MSPLTLSDRAPLCYPMFAKLMSSYSSKISGAQCSKGRLYCKCLQFFGDSNKCTSTVFSVTCPDIDDGFFKKCQYAYSVGPLLKKRKKHDFYTHYL